MCTSIRRLIFGSLRSLGITVFRSLSTFGEHEVGKHSLSEHRRVRTRCLHPLPTVHRRVGRRHSTAMVQGYCMAFGLRRCDVPGRCVNGHIRVICSTSALGVCRNLHLIAARRHSSALCTCAAGTPASYPSTVKTVGVGWAWSCVGLFGNLWSKITGERRRLLRPR